MAEGKKKFMDHVKIAGLTIAEVGVVGTSMLLQKKFLDFKTIFAKQIAKDPKFADNFLIKHEGLVKLVAFTLAASYIKNPWIKLALIGVAAGGFIQEVRVFTNNKDGVNFFDQIGQPIQTGAENNELDEEMMKAAEEATSGSNVTTEYYTAVGKNKARNPTTNYPIAVGLKLTNSLPNDNYGGLAVGFVTRPMQAA